MAAQRSISITGLGYVGLPVAVAFAKQGWPVVAFDIDAGRVNELRAGHDRTGEVAADDLKGLNWVLTSDPEDLWQADFHIVTVPTPISEAKRPDLGPLLSATRSIAPRLKKGDIVVYESTVYPGVTELECAPVLEQLSGLKFGTDFTLGYSPERINPGDKVHRFETITKVVSGSDAATLDVVADVYGAVVTAGVHRAASIAVAEAAKVIENTQRDINIALINELAMIFHRLGIDTHDVLKAAGSKWNFLPFTPGLVGGHCIGVDPYYLTHRAEQLGYHPEVILAGRRTNDAMGHYIARETVKTLMRSAKSGSGDLRVTVLGLTFKEDVPDIRNTRVVDILEELESFGIPVALHDPLADAAEVAHEYGLTLQGQDELGLADAVILAVPHSAYRQGGWPLIRSLLRPEAIADGRALVVDVKSVLDRGDVPEGINLWRL